MSYNGWPNYETWCMALWIDNEYGSYQWSRELAREVKSHPEVYGPYDETGKHGLAQALKEWQEEQMPELEASVWADLLRASFGEVEWAEIAENYLEEVGVEDV